MLTSIHIAKIGPQAAVFRPPKPRSIPGLVQADGGMATRLGTRLLPAFDVTRAVLVARWSDEAALNNFEASPLGQKFGAGWSARLEPVRATGSWTGVADDLPKARTAQGSGPVVVVTQSNLNFTKALPFLQANAAASANILAADGLAWTCAFAGPPRFGTISMWHSQEQMVANVYGDASPAHEQAMKDERAKKFFKDSVYVRLRPLSISGSLSGKNPIPENVLAVSGGSDPRETR